MGIVEHVRESVEMWIIGLMLGLRFYLLYDLFIDWIISSWLKFSLLIKGTVALPFG